MAIKFCARPWNTLKAILGNLGLTTLCINLPNINHCCYNTWSLWKCSQCSSLYHSPFLHPLQVSHFQMHWRISTVWCSWHLVLLWGQCFSSTICNISMAKIVNFCLIWSSNIHLLCFMIHWLILKHKFVLVFIHSLEAEVFLVCVLVVYSFEGFW